MTTATCTPLHCTLHSRYGLSSCMVKLGTKLLRQGVSDSESLLLASCVKPQSSPLGQHQLTKRVTVWLLCSRRSAAAGARWPSSSPPPSSWPQTTLGCSMAACTAPAPPPRYGLLTDICIYLKGASLFPIWISYLDECLDKRGRTQVWHGGPGLADSHWVSGEIIRYHPGLTLHNI